MPFSSVLTRNCLRALAALLFLLPIVCYAADNSATQHKMAVQQTSAEEAYDPHVPAIARGKISAAEYLQLRSEYFARLRGIEPGLPFDAASRGRAIDELRLQENLLRRTPQNVGPSGSFPLNPSWNEIGPRSLPNGQSQSGATIAVDGRVTAIAIDQTNANIVYIGTAQGGVWRSTNGGTTWTTIFDNAQSLAIGALAIAPSNHSILYIGTGEPNLCGDCFFGVGLYRIDNADTTTGAVTDLVGPINPAFSFVSSGGGNPIIMTTVFGGRSISQIVVDPTNAATIFVASSTGTSGSGANSLSGFIPPLGLVGVYRSTNATAAAAAITFQKLAVDTAGAASLDTPPTGNRRVSDLALEPGNPDNLLVSTFGAGTAGDGGIYRSTNARAATPTFTQTLTIAAQRIRFAVQKSGAVVTVLAATSETPSVASCSAAASQQGVLRRSVDGGVTWPATNVALATDGGILATAGGFCGGQCFYNVTVAVSPTNASSIYLGGNSHSTCSDAMKHSTDGINFLRDDTDVHADSHALAFSAAGTTIFYGSDGGVWKRADAAAGTPWVNLNASPLNTFQFVSVAAHPTDQNFTIGGTQDNGTESQITSVGNWTSAEGGDGGYVLIDQSSTDTVNVTMYHTFFNQANNLIGFDRTNLGGCLAVKDSWEFRGFGGGTDPTPSCDGTAFAAANGLVSSDSVLFYAPMALGPGTPNTLYFGTSRLYRSANRGDTMTVVSQTPLSGSTNANGSPISTIAISPQDDTYRIVGLQNGKVFGTSTGSSTLVDITSGSFPANPTGSTTNKFVGRARFSPSNKDVAYIAFSFYAPAGQGIWKITNFGAATSASPVVPIWTAAGTGIPSIPINALVIDPTDSNTVFAGTDIGVYISRDGGTSWNPYGTGLPRAAVFDMTIQPSSLTLRIATHGRGMWEVVPPLPAGIDLVYKPLAPCRIMDTRSATLASGVQGPILGNSLKVIPGFITAGQNWGQYGGTGTSDCGLASPPGTSIHAVALVATILNPNFDAYLGISDVNNLSTVLSNVALNYTATQGLSTMYIVPQIASNSIYFALPTGLSAQLIYDVVGYYVASDATALQCTTQSSAPVSIGSGLSNTATSPACTAGYTLTSGSCDSTSFTLDLTQNKASSGNTTWLCAATNRGASANLTATANCCRVPGK